MYKIYVLKLIGSYEIYVLLLTNLVGIVSNNNKSIEISTLFWYTLDSGRGTAQTTRIE